VTRGKAATLVAAAVVCAGAVTPQAVRHGDTPGKTAYAKACEACHGPEGSGGTAPALVPFTLELQELMTIVRQGIGVMPGIPRDRISDTEIAAIREYLMNLKN
jgi:mono/diheme cytochrome c family protein